MRFLTLRVFVLFRRLTRSADMAATSLVSIAESLRVLVKSTEAKPRRTPSPASFDTMDIAAAEHRWAVEKEKMEQGLRIDE